MADVLARRSARAKPPPQAHQHQSSAASSISSRTERSTRAFAKNGSPQKSAESASLSSEPPEDIGHDDVSSRRRSTHARDEDRERQPKIELLDMAPASDDQQEDDEAVRCICNHEDYPGPPPFEPDSKYGLRDAVDFERIFGIEITDEMAGNFVQCETCNSWQHSACVGFTTEESQPDDVEYFCEQCRKDLHRIFTSSTGQKYSIFLPVHRLSRAASRATSTAKETARSHSPKETNTRNSRSAAAAAAALSGKRRSTMNSRDAAYDEEEQLRRAIEASKEENADEDTELTAASRRPKRTRDDSEEKIENVKRQRTDSRSASPVAEEAVGAGQEESEDEGLFSNGGKKSRNALRNQRERAERDERREEQERKRAEAASKRKGRADRRRGDDDDPSDEAPMATRAANNRSTESAQPADPPPSSAPPPDSPPTTEPPASSHKKKTAAHPKKKGRNQYTRDRDQEHEESPARSVPREISRNGDDNTSHPKASTTESSGKQNSKSKGTMNSRVTMGDMKRRVNNILEYMSRTQVDLVNEPLHESNKTTPGNEPVNGKTDIKINGESNKKKDVISTAALSTMDFKDLSCVEMMDALTRDLVKWQQEFAP